MRCLHSPVSHDHTMGLAQKPTCHIPRSLRRTHPAPIRPKHHPSRCQHAKPTSSQPQHHTATATVNARPWLPLSQPLLWQGTEEQALSEDSCFTGLSPTWKVMLLSDGSVTRHLQLLTGAQVKVDCLEMVNVGSDIDGLPPAATVINGPRVQRTVLLRPTNNKQQQQQQPSNTNTDASSSSAAAAAASSQGQGQGQLSEHRDSSITTSNSAEQHNHQPNLFSVQAGSNGNATAHSNGISSSASQTVAASTSGNGGGGGRGGAGLPPGVPLVYAVSWWNAEEVDRYLADRDKPIWVSLSQGHVELYREVQLVMHGHSPELEQLLGCPGPFWGRQYLFWHNGTPLTCIYEVFSPLLEQYLGPSIACMDEQ